MAAIVHAEAAPASFTLHDGQHEVTPQPPGAEDEPGRLTVENMHTGDRYELELTAELLKEVLPPNFPPGASSPLGFHSLLMEAFATEAGTPSAETGVEMSCASQEFVGKTYVADIELNIGQGFMALKFPVELVVPLKEQASPEVKQQIVLRSLRADFKKEMGQQCAQLQAQLDAQQRQFELMTLQMNQRVFFGVNHSVHIKCTKLVMGSLEDQGEWQVGVVETTGGLRESELKLKSNQAIAVGNGSGLVWKFCHGCAPNCACHANRQALQGDSVKMDLTDVASASGVETCLKSLCSGLFADDTEWIMALPSEALLPLQLCTELISLSVGGPQITDLNFVAGLPKLEELIVDASQVRDLAPVGTLRSLRKLTLTNLNLDGGGEVDLTPLAALSALEEVSFKGSSAVANIAPLAKLQAIKLIDVTDCDRVTDRRAFTANAGLTIRP